MTTHAKKYFRFLALFLGLQPLALCFPGAEVPLKMNFQGRLVESGEPVDAQRSFVFKMFEAETGGAAVWTSQTHSVIVADGVFSVVLQTGTPVNLSTSTLALGKYIEISVGGVDLSPRQELLSAPFALVAQSLAPDAEMDPARLHAGVMSAGVRVAPASLYAGLVPGDVIVSSVAVDGVHTDALQDGAVTIPKIGDSGCLAGQVLKRNALNTAWECGVGAGFSGISLAPTTPDADDIANASIYLEDTGGGDLIRLLQNGADRFVVSGAGQVVASGFSAPWMKLTDNVFISSEAAPALGAGVNISTHVYIVGFSSAARYYGDGSTLTGVRDNLGSHIATTTLNMDGNSITAAAWGTFAQGVTASSFTALGAGFAGAQLRLADNVFISSDASAVRGAGVLVSSNIYIVGYSSATRYYGDGTYLDGVGVDNLGNHIATTTLNMDGQSMVNAASGTFTQGVTASSFTALGQGFSGAQIRLADTIYISSEASSALGAGISISSNVYIAGYSSATAYYGNGAYLQGVLENLGNHIATTTLNMNGHSIVNAASGTFTQGVTASSFTALGEGFSGVQLKLSGNVYISSETASALGAGVNISSNVYIVGYSSAARYYGLSGEFTNGVWSSSYTALGQGFTGAQLRLSDNVVISSETAAALGAGVSISTNVYIVGYSSAARYYGLSGEFAQGVRASSFTALGAGVSTARLELAGGVIISSEADTSLGAGVNISSNVYIVGFSSAAKYYGDGSTLFGVWDNLGNHVATTTLNMNGHGIVSAASGTFTQGVTAASFTALGEGLSAVRLALGDNVYISSEADTALGAGVNISSHVHIAGYSSATQYYGVAGEFTQGVRASSFTAFGEGLSSARLELAENVYISSEADTALGAGVNISTHVYIVGYSSAAQYYGVAGEFTQGVRASSFTAFGDGVSSARLQLAGNVYISSEADTALGMGVNISTNVYIVGFSSAAGYYGDGSGLTGVLLRTNLERTLPALNSSVQLGEFTAAAAGGGHNFYISVTVAEASWSLAKQYVLPATYNMTDGEWLDVLPISDSGCFPGLGSTDCPQDFTLEARVLANKAALRLRKSVGNTAGAAAVNIERTGPAGDSFAPASGVFGSGPHAIMSATPLTQRSGSVGIGTERPTTKLHMSSGTLTIDGNAAVSIAAVGSISAGGTVSSPRLQLDAGVALSSGAPADAGGGVMVSSNIYIVGFSSAARFFGDGSGLTNVVAGQVPDEVTLHSENGLISALASSVTLQGNVFNAAGQLVRLDAATKLPAVDGSQLTNIQHPVEIPTGAVMHFNLATCPTGWSELVAARGRYVVGLTNGGNLMSTVGTSLDNLENRDVGQHLHVAAQDAHAHGSPIYAGSVGSGDFHLNLREVDLGNQLGTVATTSNSKPITVDNSGSVAGTNAPYIQLLICQKD